MTSVEAGPLASAAYWEVEVSAREGHEDLRGRGILGRAGEVLGTRAEDLAIESIEVSDLIFLGGDGGEGLSRESIETAGRLLFSDPVTQLFRTRKLPGEPPPAGAGVLRATVL